MADARSAAPEPWLAERWERAEALIAELVRDLERLRSAVQEQHGEAAQVQETLALLDGRTRRHESGHEVAMAVRQELASLAVQLADETALRRDQAAEQERERARGRTDLRDLAESMLSLAERLTSVESTLAAERERQRAAADDVAARARAQDATTARLEALDRQLGALRDQSRRDAEAQAQRDGSTQELEPWLREAAARIQVIQQEQQRLSEEVAVLRSARDHDAELADLLEQQRASRQRMEQRFAELEERQTELARALDADIEQRRLLRNQIVGMQHQQRSQSESMEGQRISILEHLRRVTTTHEVAVRRQVEEMDRQLRSERDLLVRLIENSAAADQEQPL